MDYMHAYLYMSVCVGVTEREINEKWMQNKVFDVGPDILISKYTAGIESYDVVLILIKPAKESAHTIKQATYIHYE